jgi:hypothetical protein
MEQQPNETEAMVGGQFCEVFVLEELRLDGANARHD